jgi:Protein of unknown function (DUF3168)
MSYAAAAALQTALYGCLSTASSLSGVTIVDAMPSGTTPSTFVLIGPEQVIDQSDKSGDGAEHRFEVSVISDATGFLSAKSIAADVSTALLSASLTITTGSLISINFLRANARRLEAGEARRIDMTFRARIQI